MGLYYYLNSGLDQATSVYLPIHHSKSKGLSCHVIWMAAERERRWWTDKEDEVLPARVKLQGNYTILLKCCVLSCNGDCTDEELSSEYSRRASLSTPGHFAALLQTCIQSLMLIQAEQKNDKAFNWNEVAVLLPGRTNKECPKRWSKVQAGINKGAWTRVEDERLKKAVEGAKYVSCKSASPGSPILHVLAHIYWKLTILTDTRWSLVSKSVRTRNADRECAQFTSRNAYGLMS
jgi:hypothetical protein